MGNGGAKEEAEEANQKVRELDKKLECLTKLLEANRIELAKEKQRAEERFAAEQAQRDTEMKNEKERRKADDDRRNATMDQLKQEIANQKDEDEATKEQVAIMKAKLKEQEKMQEEEKKKQKEADAKQKLELQEIQRSTLLILQEIEAKRKQNEKDQQEAIRLLEKSKKEIEAKAEKERIAHKKEMKAFKQHVEKVKESREAIKRELEAREKRELIEKKRKEEEAKSKEYLDEKRKKINDMKPGDTLPYEKSIQFPQKALFGLFGSTGIGKTSALNSICYAVKGNHPPVRWEPVGSEDYHGGHTTARFKLQMTEAAVFVDNRGIGSEDAHANGAFKELTNQLDGKGFFSRNVDWTGNESAELPADEDAMIYCPVFVIDATVPHLVYDVLGSFVKIIFKRNKRYPLALVTKIDVATENQKEETRLLLSSTGISEIFEIANVTKEKPTLGDNYQYTLLEFVERCFVDGDVICTHRVDQQREDEKARKGNKNKVPSGQSHKN